MIVIPLTAIINGDRVIGPDLNDEEWRELKLRHKKGLDVLMACGAKGHLRLSKNGLKHFYHAKNSESCGCEPESIEHLKLKNQIYQICKSEGWWGQPEYQSPSGDWRADVFASKEDRKIVFEIQLSIIDLNELKQRDSKYHRDGIESYWILKDFLKICPYDNSKVVANSDGGVFLCNYVNEAEFSLFREQTFLVEHGIRSIGINLQDNYLYTSDILGIDISDWVKSALRGDYEKSLKDFERNYTKKLQLKESALPELEKLSDITSRRNEYKNNMRKIYAIFKSNKWEDYPTLQQEIKEMYSTFGTFDEAWRKMFSPKNGFVWKDYMQLGREIPILNFISEIQMSSLHNQIINLEDEERKFLAIYNVVKECVEKNDNITQQFSTSKPEDEHPDYYRNKKFYRKQVAEFSELVDRRPSQGTHKKIIDRSNDVMFEFSTELPSKNIESERGFKYQNVPGWKLSINRDDALEFENKGYGKILKKM